MHSQHRNLLEDLLQRQLGPLEGDAGRHELRRHLLHGVQRVARRDSGGDRKRDRGHVPRISADPTGAWQRGGAGCGDGQRLVRRGEDLRMPLLGGLDVG